MIFFDRVLLIFLGGSEFHDTNFIVTSHSDGHAFDEFSIFQYQQISLLVSLAIFGDMFAWVKVAIIQQFLIIDSESLAVHILLVRILKPQENGIDFHWRER